MPEIRYFTVTQEREVKVWANSTVEAAEIADAVFEGKIQEDNLEPSRIVSPIRETALSVREDY